VLCIRLKRFFIFYTNYLNLCRSISCRSNGLSAIFVGQKAVGQTACRSNSLSVKRTVGKKAVGRMAVGEMAVGKKAVTGTPTEVLLDIRFQLIG
jgi:hypothetical protein